MSGRHLVLVGLMGAGKTTVGRECARRLGRKFVDTDELVVAAAGLPVGEIFAAEGEPGFRARERDAVAEACEPGEDRVIACGGGAVLDHASRARLRDAGVVVWLRAPTDVLAARVGSGVGRPLLAGDAVATLERLRGERSAAYAAAAHHTVETEGLDVAAVADTVLAVLAAATR